MNPDPRGHYVYFIKPVDRAGPIKIGHSHIPVERLQVHMNWSPVKLELMALTEGGRQDEKRLHDRFSDVRSHCEWFWPTPSMMAGIRKVQAGLSIRDAFSPAEGMSTALKTWRTDAQIDAENAAKLAGVSLPTWSRWETGARKVPAERLPALSRLTGIPMEVLRPEMFAEAS